MVWCGGGIYLRIFSAVCRSVFLPRGFCRNTAENFPFSPASQQLLPQALYGSYLNIMLESAGRRSWIIGLIPLKT